MSPLVHRAAGLIWIATGACGPGMALAQPLEARGEGVSALSEGDGDGGEDSAAAEFRISPRVWFVAPGGRFILPGETDGGRDIDVEMVNLDSPRVSPMLELEARFLEDWSVTLGAFAFDINAEASSPVSRTVGDVPIQAGDPLDSELRFAGGDLLAGYALVDRGWGTDEPGAVPVHARVDVQFGARLHHVDIELVNLSGSLAPGTTTRASGDEIFVEPVVGVRGELEIDEQWHIEVGASFGGFAAGDHQSLSWDIRTAFAWRPTRNLGAHVGFRILSFDLDDGSGVSTFEYRGSLSGLFAGIDIRF